MENHEGRGGSYVRNPDGTLTLVERTISVEEAAAIEAGKKAADPPSADTTAEVEAPAPSGKKK